MQEETAAQAERRVNAAELSARLGITQTWLRVLERTGRIPAAHRDPGARRKWWLESEARAIVAGPQASKPEQRQS